MKRRELTLAGSILGTVMFALMTLGNIIQLATFAILCQVLTSGVETSEYVAYSVLLAFIPIFAIMLVFCVVSLILNACSISTASATPENYARRKGLTITTAVFNFLTYLFTFSVTIAQFVLFFNVFAVFNFLGELGVLVGGILLIVDLFKEKSRVAGIQNAPLPPVQNPRPFIPAPQPPVQAPQPPIPAPQPKNGIDALTNELNKLNELRQNGIISDEEFDELKHKILLKY